VVILAPRRRSVTDTSSPRRVRLPPHPPSATSPFQEVTTARSRRLSLPSDNPVHSAGFESLPSSYPSGSASSLSPTLRAAARLELTLTQHTQSASRCSTPNDSPTNGTVRRLPTSNAHASSTSFSATVAKSPRSPGLHGPRFRAIPHLPNTLNVKPAPPPVMYWSKAIPTHEFCAHTVALADYVACIFGGSGDKGCFKDM
jgi:hypothetical protein